MNKITKLRVAAELASYRLQLAEINRKLDTLPVMTNRNAELRRRRAQLESDVEDWEKINDAVQ